MGKWLELKSWLCNELGRLDGTRDECCESIRVSAVLAKMLYLEREEMRMRREEFVNPFDGEH